MRPARLMDRHNSLSAAIYVFHDCPAWCPAAFLVRM
jgi:hypothetical protein